MDPVEFRRANIVDEGVEGAAGQVYGEIDLPLSRCCRWGLGLRRRPADDEAVGVAISWWPSFPGPSGAYIKIDSDGSGMIITGAQECGTGSVMTLRMLAAKELGMEPEDFQLVYQDTSAAPYDTGATGSQTLLNNGRAVVEGAREVAAQLRDLALTNSKRPPTTSCSPQGRHMSPVARQGRLDRRAGRYRRRRRDADRERFRTPPEYPSVSAMVSATKVSPAGRGPSSPAMPFTSASIARPAWFGSSMSRLPTTPEPSSIPLRRTARSRVGS